MFTIHNIWKSGFGGANKFLYRTNVEFQMCIGTELGIPYNSVSPYCIIIVRTALVWFLDSVTAHSFACSHHCGVCLFFVAVPCSVVSSVWMPFPLLCVGAVLVCCFIHSRVWFSVTCALLQLVGTGTKSRKYERTTNNIRIATKTYRRAT